MSSVCFLNIRLSGQRLGFQPVTRKWGFFIVLPQLQRYTWTSTQDSLHSHRHIEVGTHCFPLSPLPLTPGISKRGFHMGPWNTLSHTIHSSYRVLLFLLGSHSISSEQLPSGPHPSTELRKDSWKTISSVSFNKEKLWWRSVPSITSHPLLILLFILFLLFLFLFLTWPSIL